jgi:tetratricopeptide (TPR) repeat protein
LRCHREHLELSDELSDPLGKHSATGGLGEVLYSLGDYDGALDKHLSRIDVAEQMEDRLGAARGYFGSSLALYALGRHAKATEAATKALRIFEDVKSWQVMEVQKQLSLWQPEKTGT